MARLGCPDARLPRPSGRVADEILYRHDEPRLELVQNDRRAGTVGFALRVLQRRLASSPRRSTSRSSAGASGSTRASASSSCARPWLAELPFVAAPHGPNWLSWHEAVMEALAGTGLSAADIAQMLSVIDGYTRGASDTAISLARARARGTSEEEWAAAVGADLGRAIGDPRFPRFAALLTTPSDGPSRTMKESFDFGLQRVLDGIELYIKAATPTSRR